MISRNILLKALLLGACICILGLSKNTTASPPDWDRKILTDRILFFQDDSNRISIQVPVGIVSYTDTAVDANLSTCVRVSVGDVTSDSAIMMAVGGVPNGCPGNCEYCPMYCDSSEFGCFCGIIIPGLFDLGVIPMGTAVRIDLSPAPGAFTEQFTDNDTATVMYLSATIPTLTEWGLIIFGLVLLGFITWVFLKRKKVIGVRV